ncbi:MAG: RluA family pseudouridine synthase [Desulfobacterales bacterium]
MTKDCLFVPQWPILYTDNHLLALYKPAGLPVQGDDTRDISLLDLGKHWIKEKYAKPGNVFLGLVHRLDRPVAGVVLFCRTSKAAARISEQFRSKTAGKTYLAVLQGRLKQPSGELLHYIQRIPHKSSRIVSHRAPSAAQALLTYRKKGESENTTLVEIDLKTGRHHQIRAQFSHIGHPIVGDLRYGAAAPLPEKQIALLAACLEISHPISGQRIRMESPLPGDWPWKRKKAKRGFSGTGVTSKIRLPLFFYEKSDLPSFQA